MLKTNELKDTEMKTLISVLIFFAMNAFAAQENEGAVESTSCSVENVFERHIKDRDVKTIASLKIIEIKDQKIYGLFTSHIQSVLREPIYKIMILLLSEEDGKLYKDGEQREEAFEQLKDILGSRSYSVKDERLDVLNIVGLLNSNGPDLRWIGIEKSEEDLEKNPIQRELHNYEIIKWLLGGILTPEEVEDTLYLLFSNHITAIAEHPELFREIEIFPLEDNTYRLKARHLYQEGEKILIDLYLILTGNKSGKSNVDRVIAITRKALSKVKKIPSQVILNELNNWKDEESRALVERYFENTNQFIENVHERDQAIASNALRQSGNGLMLLGAAHAEGVMQYLLSACRDLQ